ncbi:MAG TPA: hypothetical protein VJ757_00780 [Pseudonocardiaceae bacterium]|nr:hypothetical protein [Pseudonocardiaceae bacterium]
MTMIGLHRRFGESSVIYQTQLAEAIKHGLADFFGNPAPPQSGGQLSPAAWPGSEQPQADALRVRCRAHDFKVGAVLRGRFVGFTTTIAHGSF